MIKAILAVDQVGGIGLNGTLPWPHNKEDMKWFQDNTSGHIVVMGRTTWDDPKMPKPLPNRINLVATSRPINMPGVMTVKGDIPKRMLAIQSEFPNKDIFFIGGKKLIESCIASVDQLYLTQFRGSWKADTFIDMRWLLQDFRIKTVVPGETCTFSIYDNERILKSS